MPPYGNFFLSAGCKEKKNIFSVKIQISRFLDFNFRFRIQFFINFRFQKNQGIPDSKFS